MTPTPPKDVYPLNTHPVPPSGLFFFFPCCWFCGNDNKIFYGNIVCMSRIKAFFYFQKDKVVFFNFGLNGWKNMLRNFYGKGASFSFQNAKGGWTTNSNHGCFCLFVLFVNSVLLNHRGLLIDIFSCGLLVLYWFKRTNQRNLLGNIRFTLQHIRISDAEWCHGCYTDIAHIALGSAPLLWFDNIATSPRIVFYLRETLKCVSCFVLSLWTVICSATHSYWIPSTKCILIGFSHFVINNDIENNI